MHLPRSELEFTHETLLPQSQTFAQSGPNRPAIPCSCARLSRAARSPPRGAAACMRSAHGAEATDPSPPGRCASSHGSCGHRHVDLEQQHDVRHGVHERARAADAGELAATAPSARALFLVDVEGLRALSRPRRANFCSTLHSRSRSQRLKRACWMEGHGTPLRRTRVGCAAE